MGLVACCGFDLFWVVYPREIKLGGELMRDWFRSNRRLWLLPMLAGVFVGSLWWCGWLWPFTLGLLLVVWGIRVRNENREDHLFQRLVRNYDRR